MGQDSPLPGYDIVNKAMKFQIAEQVVCYLLRLLLKKDSSLTERTNPSNRVETSPIYWDHPNGFHLKTEIESGLRNVMF
jgi:hypothetical protein